MSRAPRVLETAEVKLRGPAARAVPLRGIHHDSADVRPKVSGSWVAPQQVGQGEADVAGDVQQSAVRFLHQVSDGMVGLHFDLVVMPNSTGGAIPVTMDGVPHLRRGHKVRPPDATPEMK